jgi:hypothetical protein
MPTLYHYSALINLPAILREGLRLGEIAGQFDPGAQAVSLTTQTDPVGMQLWGMEVPNKTAVRFACAIPDGDARLEATRKAWKRLRVPKGFFKFLDPAAQSRLWYFYHGVIAAERFVVQLRGRGGYVDATAEALAALAEEEAKFQMVSPPGRPWVLEVSANDPAYADYWYFTDEYPADRLGLVRPARSLATRAA